MAFQSSTVPQVQNSRWCVGFLLGCCCCCCCCGGGGGRRRPQGLNSGRLLLLVLLLEQLKTRSTLESSKFLANPEVGGIFCGRKHVFSHHLLSKGVLNFRVVGICLPMFEICFLAKWNKKYPAAQMIATNHRLRIPPNGGDLVRESLPLCPFMILHSGLVINLV